jgi:hypothetical protein
MPLGRAPGSIVSESMPTSDIEAFKTRGRLMIAANITMSRTLLFNIIPPDEISF